MKTYATYVFDCDGVLLDSNNAKDDAFYELALPYGQEAAKTLLKYHHDYGGVSRFKKFDYFFKEILGWSSDKAGQKAQECIQAFGELSSAKMRECQITKGTRQMLESLPKEAKKYVVSGGEQNELRATLEFHQLSPYFDGIYGSPTTKIEILETLQNDNALPTPAIFFGDASTDYKAASHFGMDFVFLTEYTGFTDWKEYFTDKSIVITERLDTWLSLK